MGTGEPSPYGRPERRVEGGFLKVAGLDFLFFRLKYGQDYILYTTLLLKYLMLITKDLYTKILLLPMRIMPRKTTSIKIDVELWKEARKKCIDLETEISTYLEGLIKKDLGVKK